jgi:hypothetical protein
MVKIQYVGLFRIEKGLYTLDAKLSNGEWVYHEGPRDYPYFTKAQAQALLNRVKGAMRINLDHWTDGKYHRDEMAEIEREYYDAMIGA